MTVAKDLVPGLVSVIVPCRNEQHRITGLLQAIVAQTFPLGRIEVIIADGMSSDQTRPQIREFQDRNPSLRITVIDNPQQVIPTALNRAIAEAKGEFILRLDAHSAPEPEYIEWCVQDLNEAKGDNVGGYWVIVPGDDTWIAKSIASAASNKLGAGDARYRTSGEAGIVETVPFGAYRKATLEGIGGYDESLLSNEDYDLNHRIMEQGGKVYFDPRIRIQYVARSNLRELGKQYWRYGFWKVKMLKKFPGSLRSRQALPPLFVLYLILGAIISFISSPFKLVFLGSLLLYLLLVILSALPAALKSRDLRMLMGIPLAIMTMHISWGSGFLWSLIESWKTKPAK